jgi:DNA-directed RNA polymerase subunit RPC12/RpoP
MRYSDKARPQRCSSCDRIGHMEDINLDTWTCRYCQTENRYVPGSRFSSSGKGAYVECMCGYKIRVGGNSNLRTEVRCPHCGVTLHIRNTKLQVTGKNSSEVLDVVKGCVDKILEAEPKSTLPSTNISVSGGSVQ